ncbi:MtN3 and saliva related transmembrane protein [Hypnocyclicus thermotrophus]|uniref:MtN3 and saliva related transmembrane protein n=1 Tax=Hypnocyclicus thermotrophus TaxID=1627895 RepID=A0AA46I622_9FUSO|nr:SemiSWEET transporter [Hypnocyclicus thermotrophus]TDT71580.1 MtN3 and saliva related transmembrane protein [Hypnocyclicus thermotrophus]
MFFKIIGLLAAVLTTFSFLPQAIKTIKTQNTEGLSLGMYSIFTTGVLFWIIYGFYLKDIAIISANIITFIFAISILIVLIKNNFKK